MSTEKERASYKRYNHSEKGIARRYRHEQTERRKTYKQKYREEHPTPTEYYRERYHRIQDEAGYYHDIGTFYPGYRIIQALLDAGVVEVSYPIKRRE